MATAAPLTAIDRRRELLVRGRSGQPVAAARGLRAPRHHRRGRRRGAHRHVDERATRAVPAAVDRAPACSSSAPRGWPTAACSPSGTDGTGPFVLEEAVPNDHYTFRARDDYTWGPDGATTDVARLPLRGGAQGRRERVDGGQPAAVGRGQRGCRDRARPPAPRGRGLLRRREPDRSSASSSSTTWTACRPPTSPSARR